MACSDAYSFLELLFAVGLVATLLATAVPMTHAAVDYTRTAGAARYTAGRLQWARMEALKRSAHVAASFDASAGNRVTFYLDGNGDGVRSRDITDGVDPAISSPEALEDQFPGVRFAAGVGLPPIEAGEAAPDPADPIRLGRTDILSFGPLGTATAGTLFVRGGGGTQFAVRILGPTGRIRVLRFEPGSRKWIDS